MTPDMFKKNNIPFKNNSSLSVPHDLFTAEGSHLVIMNNNNYSAKEFQNVCMYGRDK